MKIAYSDRFDLSLGDHIFPAVKYRMIRDSLLAGGHFGPESFIEPAGAADEDILRVHTPEYVAKLRGCGFTIKELLQMEIPYSKQLVDAFLLGTGGTIAACRWALEDGIGATLSGGFHHAFADHAEGFCLLNDVAVGIRSMQSSGGIRTAMTVDCDVHHGNGTAHIFRSDPSVFTLSIHQFNNYPPLKPPSNLDIHLNDGTGDEEYLAKLEHGLSEALERFSPDLLVYLAGADPYRQDQLGGLSLTISGLERRDRLVFDAARRRKIPLAVTLAGGYSYRVEDTVAIHVNTVRAALEMWL